MPKAAAKPHVLLVEADTLLADLYGGALANDFNVSLAKDAQTAIDRMDDGNVAVLVTDVLVGRHDGVEIIQEVRSHDDWLRLPIIILSSLAADDFPLPTSRWESYGIRRVLYKPTTKPDHLAAAVRQVLGLPSKP